MVKGTMKEEKSEEGSLEKKNVYVRTQKVKGGKNVGEA